MTDSHTTVLLGGFCDEAAIDKTLDQQFSVFAALGLRWLTLRFVDFGDGVKNVMDFSQDDIHVAKEALEKYDLKVSCIGSPIGKVKLCDIEDGTSNRYVSFDTYLNNDVQRACDLANQFDCKLIRGFSFYHPKGSRVEDHIGQATDQLAQIAEVVDSHQLTFGLEVEANLVGHNGHLLQQIHSNIASSALVLVFDGANLVTQGYSEAEIYDQYRAMKAGLGWMHVKDFRKDDSIRQGDYVDEESLNYFVPATMGNSGYETIFADLRDSLPEISQRMTDRGVPGVFVDLEPHVKGGGQFGGFSGPDGFGVAMRELCKLLKHTGLLFPRKEFSENRN